MTSGPTSLALADLSAVLNNEFWKQAELVPSPTCANGDCLLHSVARSPQQTIMGWKASNEEVSELRQATADLMRAHSADLSKFNLYHHNDFERYCSVYGKAPPGMLPSAYWSDDCAVLCLALHLDTTIVKVEPCSDGSLLFSLFHQLQRREGVEQDDVLKLLRSGSAICTYFNGSNHFTRCVVPAEDQSMPSWPTALPSLGHHPPEDGDLLGEEDDMMEPLEDDDLLAVHAEKEWVAELQHLPSGGRAIFYRSMYRQEEMLCEGSPCMWFGDDMQWQYGIILSIFRLELGSELQCLAQMFSTSEDGVMCMGLFMLLDVQDVSTSSSCWYAAQYSCGDHVVDLDEARVMRTFDLGPLADQVWASGERLWAGGGGRLLQQHSMPLQHVGTLYSKPSRSTLPCDLCDGWVVHWRFTICYVGDPAAAPGGQKKRKRPGAAIRIVHLCEGCQEVAVPLLSLQLQLREWRHHRLENNFSKPVDDVVALNLIMPFVEERSPLQEPYTRALSWADARQKLADWLPPLPS